MKNLLFVALVASVGCGNKSGGTAEDDKVASCLSESTHGCREYRGGNLAAGSDGIAGLCTVVDKAAKFTMTACPTANVIGFCKKPEGKDFFYQGYEIPVADLEKQCTSGGGTWSK
jgi:hypothetical protein